MNKEKSLPEVYLVIFPYIDFEFYRAMYGDISDPVQHYIDNWQGLQYDPCRFFSTAYYYSINLDVANANVNPFFHYVIHGQKEGRLARDPVQIQDDLQPWELDDPELSFSNWELPCVFNDEKIINNPYGDIAHLLHTLIDIKASGLVLNRGSKNWLIYFSGRNENFYFLNKTLKSNVNVLILRDKDHKYYCAGTSFPTIQKLEAYINYLTDKRSGDTVFAGQSYGGYCALYQSTRIKNTVCFAFSPQAFHPALASYNIFFQKGINKLRPQPTPDLVQAISSSENQARYVIVGLSEYHHISSYYWGDLLSAGLLASTGNACVVVVDQHEHSTLRHLDGENFLSIIFDNFKLFQNQPHDAAALLANSAIYYEKTQATGI